MNNKSILEHTPLVFLKKCDQLVQKQSKKFEMNFKQVSSNQKEKIMGKPSNYDRVFLNDKTLVKPLSYSRYLKASKKK